MYKLIVYVPRSHLNKVLDAVFAAGAGKMGSYSDCAFICEGTGTFRPLKGSKPFKGKTGKLTKVRETRIETAVQGSKLKKVIAAMKKNHPYEVPAYDVLKLY